MSRRTRLVASLALLASVLTAADPILIDGSSTVYPISLAVGEAYHAKTGTTFEINVSGTTGGMRLFTSGKLPLAGASRPIRPDEVEACAAAGITFVEIPIALDGLTVAVGSQNTFIDHLSLAELKALWEPGSTVATWSQVRATWPSAPVALYGPGRSSGTFDFFTEAVNGKARAVREDWTGSEDDNELVQALVVNGHALGYFGLSYYLQNKAQLRAIPIDAGHGSVLPTHDTVLDGSYAPFSRPLFYYVTTAALDRPEIRGYLETVLSSPRLVEEAGYVALGERLLTVIRRRLDERTAGSLFQRLEGHPRLAEIYLGAPALAPAPALAAPAKPAPQPKAAPVVAAPPVAAPPKVADAPKPAVVAEAPTLAPSVTAKPAAPVSAEPVAAPIAAPVVAAPAPAPVAPAAVASADLERLRTASFTLARASLQKQPDPAELKRLAREVAALAGNLP